MISAIVPVRDGERYLGEALASLRAQTLPPGEIIVVDDGSRDGSAALAESFGAKVIRTPPEGPGAARNTGVRVASGDLVAFLDADDLATPDRLERQARAIPCFDACFAAVRHFLSPDRPELAEVHEVPSGVQATPHAGTTLVSRERFLATGGFDPACTPAEFIEWLDRARAGGLTECQIDDVVLERRVHGGNLTLRADRAGYARAARAAVLRRRAS